MGVGGGSRAHDIASGGDRLVHLALQGGQLLLQGDR